MKNVFVVMIFLSVAAVSQHASADFTIGCSHWENAAPALPDYVYNWCEVTLLDEEIVAGVDTIGIDSHWESDVYYQSGAVWELNATYDDDALQAYPGPYVTGNIVNDWADLTEVYGRVRTPSGQLLNHDEYCWDTDFLYYVTASGWTTYSTDSDCEVTSGFTF